MKRLRLFSLLLILILLLGACRSAGDINGTASSEPAESKLRITAAFDFLAASPELTTDLDMNIVDDYSLILDLNSAEYRHNLFYQIHSGGYRYVTIVPEIVEKELEEKAITYEVRTNYGGLFTDQKTSAYVGNCVTVDRSVVWRGADGIPAEDRMERPDRSWIDMVVKESGVAVGVVVLEIVDWYLDDVAEGKEPCGLTIEYKYSEYYPVVNGQMQNITEDFAWQRIEAYHQYEEQKTE